MSRLKEMSYILWLPCSQSARLISESLEHRLPWHLRTAVWLHWFTCGPCRRFRKQMLALQAALARLTARRLPPAQATLSVESRSRIAAAIRERHGNT